MVLADGGVVLPAAGPFSCPSVVGVGWQVLPAGPLLLVWGVPASGPSVSWGRWSAIGLPAWGVEVWWVLVAILVVGVW